MARRKRKAHNPDDPKLNQAMLLPFAAPFLPPRSFSLTLHQWTKGLTALYLQNFSSLAALISTGQGLSVCVGFMVDICLGNPRLDASLSSFKSCSVAQII